MKSSQCLQREAEALAQGIVSLPVMSLQMMQRNQRKITTVCVPKGLKLEELDALWLWDIHSTSRSRGKCNFPPFSAK